MINLIYLFGSTTLALLISTLYFYRESKRVKERPESIELQEFLMDLATGGSFLHVKRLPPGDMIMRRRK